MNEMKLSPIEKKVLSDFWILSTKNTVEALSQMIRKEVNILSCSMKRIWVNRVPRFLNPKEISFTLIYTKILGSLNGIILLASSLKDVLKLADLLLHKKIGYYKALSDENLPVLLELANILQGYYISSLVKLFGAELKWTSPSISVNAYRAIEEFDFGPIYIQKIYVHMFNAKIKVKKERIKFQIVLLFKDEEIKKILEMAEKRVRIV